MKSIKRRFEKLEKDRPSHSTYLNFAAAIGGQNFSDDRLGRHFDQLVDRDDYARAEKRGILEHLRELTRSEAYKNRG